MAGGNSESPYAKNYTQQKHIDMISVETNWMSDLLNMENSDNKRPSK